MQRARYAVSMWTPVVFVSFFVVKYCNSNYDSCDSRRLSRTVEFSNRICVLVSAATIRKCNGSNSSMNLKLTFNKDRKIKKRNETLRMHCWTANDAQWKSLFNEYIQLFSLSSVLRIYCRDFSFASCEFHDQKLEELHYVRTRGGCSTRHKRMTGIKFARQECRLINYFLRSGVTRTWTCTRGHETIKRESAERGPQVLPRPTRPTNLHTKKKRLNFNFNLTRFEGRRYHKRANVRATAYRKIAEFLDVFFT